MYAEQGTRFQVGDYKNLFTICFTNFRYKAVNCVLSLWLEMI